MWNFLKSDSPDSSLRVNMLIVASAIGFILIDIGVIMLAYAFIPIEIIYTGSYNLGVYTLKYVYRPIDFIQIGTAVGLMLAGAYSIWYGKKQNKEAENETPKPGQPAQPNQNV